MKEMLARIKDLPNSTHVVEMREPDLRMKERLFTDAYKVRSKIQGVSYHDDKWNWDLVVLKFKDSLGKNYGLIEYYPSGDDNSTLYVDLEYEKDGEFFKKRFDKFIDAELDMVKLMQKRLNGED